MTDSIRTDDYAEPAWMADYRRLKAYYDAHPDEAKQDAAALASDWKAVGDDLYKALRLYRYAKYVCMDEMARPSWWRRLFNWLRRHH